MLLTSEEKTILMQRPGPEKQEPDYGYGHKPTGLEKGISFLTFGERTSAALAMSILAGNQFSENMQDWVDYTDVVEYMMPEAPTAVKIGLSFALGVALDPITYMGFGLLTKGGKAARLTGKTYGVARKSLLPTGEVATRTIQIPISQMRFSEQAAQGLRGAFGLQLPFTGAQWTPELGEEVYKLTGKLGEQLGKLNFVQKGRRMFVSPTGSALSDNSLWSAQAFAEANVKQVIGRSVGYKREWIKELKKKGLNNKDIANYVAKMGHYYETGAAGDTAKMMGIKLLPDQYKMIDQIRKSFDDIRKFEIDNRLPVHDLEDDLLENYLPHMATKGRKGGQEFFNQQGLTGLGSGNAYSPRHASMRRRMFRGQSIKELNEKWARDAGFTGEKLFEDDPFLLIALRAERAMEAVKNQKFLDNVMTDARKQNLILSFDAGNWYQKLSTGWKAVRPGTKGAVNGVTATKQVLRGKGGEWQAFVEGGQLSRKASTEMLSQAAIRAEALDNPLVPAGILLDKVIYSDDFKKSVNILTKTGVPIHIMPADIASELSKVSNVLSSGTPGKGFLNVFDGVQNWWKAYTLGIFPAYQFRNMVDDTFRNMLAGVNPLTYQGMNAYRRAAQYSIRLNAVNGDLTKLPEHMQRLLKPAFDRGIIDGGLYGAELPDAAFKSLTVKSFNPFDTENVVLGFAKRLGRVRENTWRLANHLWQVDEGVKHLGVQSLEQIGPEQLAKLHDGASNMVRKYNFNYREITPTEQAVWKRLFPFYTFTRKNLPLQIEHLMNHPGMYAAIDKGRRSWEMKDGPYSDARMLSEFIKDNYPVRVGVDDNGIEKFFVGHGWLSAFDLIRFLNPETSWREAWFMMSPLPKEAAAQFFNYDPFFQSAIERHPGETERFLGTVLPRRWTHILKNLRVFSEANRLLWLSGFDEAIKGEPSHNWELSPLEGSLRYLTGFKMYPQDPVRGMSYYEYHLKNAIQKRESALRRIQRNYQMGRMDLKHFSHEAELLLKQIEELRTRPETVEATR